MKTVLKHFAITVAGLLSALAKLAKRLTAPRRNAWLFTGLNNQNECDFLIVQSGASGSRTSLARPAKSLKQLLEAPPA